MNYFISYLIIFAFPVYLASGQGYVAALGGGSVPDNVYEWIVEKSGNGKVIVLSYTDASNSLPDFFRQLGASDSYNLTIDSRSKADLQSTYDEIVSADAVYLRGGNQWIYVRDWKGTKTEDAIRQVFQNGGVVSGTSAGAMVLSEYIFTARYGSVQPPDALNNPTAIALDIGYDFINVVPGVLIDTHFIERGRFGRLIPFLFKLYVQRAENILGIGIDDQTALCIEPDGTGTVKGTGAVAFFNITDETKIISSFQGFTVENIRVDQLVENWKYDLMQREVVYIPQSAKHVNTDREWNLPLTDIWLSGSDGLDFNTSSLMPLFFDNEEAQHLLIISTSDSGLEALYTYLDSQSVIYSTYYIGSSDLIDLESVDAIIFAGINPGDARNDFDENTQITEWIQGKIENATPLIFFGNSGKLSGSLFVDGVDDDEWAAYRGMLTIHEGLNAFGDFLFQPSVFDDIDYFENRTASVLWGLMKNRGRVGMYLESGGIISIESENGLIKRHSDDLYLLIDASHTEWVDSSGFRASGSVGPRQVVAMTNLRYHVSSIEEYYSIESGTFGVTSNAGNRFSDFPEHISLKQNFPNPFNDQTIISFSLPRASTVSLQIYDILGNKITTLVNQQLDAGYHSIPLRTSDLQFSIASGVYFYRLVTDTGSISKKMLYVR